MRPLLVSLFIVSLVSCAKDPGALYFQLESAAEPHYRVYFEAEPRAQFEAMLTIDRLMEAADPAVWKAMDRGSYAAWVYGRASLAAARAGMEEEARKYRKKAVDEHRRRKTWNNVHQKMLPVTPSPSHEQADRELFAGIVMMDDVIRKEGFNSQKANQ